VIAAIAARRELAVDQQIGAVSFTVAIGEPDGNFPFAGFGDAPWQAYRVKSAKFTCTTSLVETRQRARS
jgi:hypothetical protein